MPSSHVPGGVDEGANWIFGTNPFDHCALRMACISAVPLAMSKCEYA